MEKRTAYFFHAITLIKFPLLKVIVSKIAFLSVFKLAKKIDVLQSRPSAGGHKIQNFRSKMLDFLATGYLPFFKMF